MGIVMAVFTIVGIGVAGFAVFTIVKDSKKNNSRRR